MKRKKVIIGISIAAVLTACAVVLGVVFGVRAKNPPHEHEYDFTAITWEWEESEAQASVQCACGKTLVLQTEIAQKTILPANCEEAGRALFTAKFTADGAEYSDEKQVDLPALGHDFDYTAILWRWDEDAPTASANIPCKRGEHTLTVTPEINEEILIDPACESEGSALYTARLISGEEEYIDTSSRKLPALGHDYNSEFEWETDWSAATLYLACKRECGKTHSERVESVFSHVDATCEKNGIDTHTVRTTYDGKPFEEAHGRVIPASGHDYDYTKVEWLWQDREAKAVVKCKRDSNHSMQIETEIQEEVLKQPACEEEGEGRYTAVFQREGNRYSDEKLLPIPAVGHDYNFAAAVWQWEGTQSASATVPCTRNSAHTQTIPAEIMILGTGTPSCTQPVIATYVATVKDGNGNRYTDRIEREMPLGEHTYSKAEFWNNDTHELVCTNCGHQEYEAHENDDNKICTLCGVSTWLYYGNEGLTVTVSAYPNEVMGYDSSITKIVIPGRYYYDGLTATVYEVYNFQYCNGLESVIISDGVKQITANAFSGCSSLKEVIVPSEFMHIGTHAFSGCSALTEFVYPKNLTLIMDYTFINCIALTKVTLPEGLNSIGEGAFQGCTALREINVPSTVTRIDEKAFFNCRALSLDNLPSRLQYIGGSAFYYCESLTEITFPSSVTTIGDSAFSGCSGIKSIAFNGILEKIGLFTFNNCTSLTNVKLPYGLKEIGYGSFSGCSSLAQINLPSGLQSIGQQAFDCCTSLAKIELPSGLQSIGQQAFRECTSLKTIIIPRSVETMGAYVFQSAENITIYCEAASKPSKWSADWNASRPVFWAYAYVVDDEYGMWVDD
ncbi:MAG: leucine-rich repeat domain-containing protein [Clostridia bacterium]|nr:leucine-rich repeat domain-containing protein [Clostridia bacterium]